MSAAAIEYRVPVRMRSSLDACNSDVEITAKACHMSDGKPYDVINIGDLTLYLDRRQTAELRDKLSAMIALGE